MIDETFTLKKSCIHGVHPVLSFVVVFLCVLIIAMSCKLPTLFVAFVVSILTVFIVKLDLKFVIKRLFPVFGFLILIWLVIPWSYEGEIIFKKSFFVFSYPGVFLAMKITLKSVSIILLFMVFVSTVTLDAFGVILKKFRVPDKMIYLFLMTYRYLFVFEKEYRKIIRAIIVRNFRPRTDMHTYRTYAYLIGMLFIRAHERGKRVHNAMLCRSFNGRFFDIRKYYLFNYQNLVFVLCASFFLIMLIFFEIFFNC